MLLSKIQLNGGKKLRRRGYYSTSQVESLNCAKCNKILFCGEIYVLAHKVGALNGVDTTEKTGMTRKV